LVSLKFRLFSLLWSQIFD